MKALTSAFLLPILRINMHYMKQNGFKNAYLGDDGFLEDTGIRYDQHLFVLVEPTNINDSYLKFDKKLHQHDLFVDSYDIEEGKVMYIFKIPTKWSDDVQAFKKGKYSKISREFVSSYYLKSDDAYLVWSKSPTMKEYWENKTGIIFDISQELWSKPERETEIYRYSSNIYKEFEDEKNLSSHSI